MQVSSVSNFHPDTGGGGDHLLGSRVQFPQGERTTANKHRWGVWGALAVSGPHWVCPTHGVCAVPVYTAQAPGCSAGDLSKASSGLHALPRSKPLRFRFSGTSQGHRLGWACVLCPSQVRAARATRSLGSACSPGGLCVLSPPPSQLLSFPGAQRENRLWWAVCLLWGADLWLRPSWWMSTLQDPRKTWLATGSLHTVWWRMPSLGPRLPLTFWLFSHLPAPLPLVWGGASLQLVSSPLVFAQSFVL